MQGLLSDFMRIVTQLQELSSDYSWVGYLIWVGWFLFVIVIYYLPRPLRRYTPFVARDVRHVRVEMGTLMLVLMTMGVTFWLLLWISSGHEPRWPRRDIAFYIRLIEVVGGIIAWIGLLRTQPITFTWRMEEPLNLEDDLILPKDK